MAKDLFISERLKFQPCPIGIDGFCCKNCLMGPCRVIRGQKGVCGASQELVVSRNILRFVAGGAAAHCGHALHLLEYLNQSYPKNYIKAKAPETLYKLWEKLEILPKEDSEHFKDISEALHTTTMGVNADYQDVLKRCLKLGIIDGYYGMYLSTELEDKKFGKPKIKKGKLNLDCLDVNKVNIAVHGHEPMLAEAMVKEASKHDDVNLVGVCCTGATLLAKHGVPLAAHFMLQEDVIATGIVEAMVVDIQCIMPSLSDLCECYHTKLITTNEIAKMPNAFHMPIKNEADAEKVAKKIVDIARENMRKRRKDSEKEFEKRDKQPKEVVVGFSEDNIGTEKIAEMIKKKEIKGVIAVVGCVNPRANQGWVDVFKKLSKDYIIIATGCMAFEFGKYGLLDGERFFHLGSCVNNSRVGETFKRISEHLKKDIRDMPFLVSCPMPITEKSFSIGSFFMALGCDIHLGYHSLISSNENVAKFLRDVLKIQFKSKIYLEESPEKFYKSL